MSIKKPSAVESPYVTTDTTPVRLVSGPVAGGGVNTVAATVPTTVSANANTASSSTGSNVSYYTAGVEGINQLANYGRVFSGANVYVTLEQPQYITYNQTFTGSDIGNSISVTGNITSGEYFIGDGSQLTGISSSGNFIVNGASKVDVVAPGGNVTVDTNGNAWTFTPQNVLTAPGGSSWRNQANADAYFTSSLDGYVHLQSLFADGNVGSEVFLQHGLLTLTAHSLGANTDYTWTFDNSGNLTLPGNSFQINYANGDQVTLGSGASNYIVNGNSYANIASANGNLAININGNAWGFNSSSQLVAPGGSRWTNQANSDAYFASSLNGYVHLQSLFSDGNVGSEMFLQHGLATITAHSVGANTDYTWTFDNSANLGLPAGSNISDTTGTLVIEANAGSSLTLKTTNGNAYTRFEAGADYAQIGLQDDTTGAYQAWTYLETDMANVNTPSAAVILKPGDTGAEVRWTFDAVGNLTVPGNILGSGNILIAPDSASSSSYLDIYLTGGPDIHIASNDNSIVIGRDTGANIFVGNDGEVSIQTDNGVTPQVWNFDNTGNLTTPTGNGGDITLTGGNINGANVVVANTVVGNGNIHLQPSAGNSGAYLDIYLTTGPDIHIAGNGENVIVGGDSSANVTVNASNGAVTIQSWNGTANTWTFDSTGVLTVPGEGIIQSLNDTVILQSKDTGSGNIYSARLGTNGGLYFATSDYPAGWLDITNNAGNANITAAQGTSGAAGKNLYLTAGAADQTDYYTTAGGNLNLIGGLGAFNDGGGGGPGGAVNITSGLSADPAGHAGNVTINTGGANTWTFDYTGNLTTPGNISGANIISANIFSATGNITGGNILSNGIVKTSVFATGNIPGASSVGAGARAFVVDADSVTFANLYVGGASNAMPVWSDGTNWYIG